MDTDDDLLRLVEEDRAEGTPPDESKDSPAESTETPLAIQILHAPCWQDAARIAWTSAVCADVPVPAAFGSMIFREKRYRYVAGKIAECMFEAGRGEDALAFLLLAVDTSSPTSCDIVLPQVTYLARSRWDLGKDTEETLKILAVWWRIARGELAGNTVSSPFELVHTVLEDELAKGADTRTPSQKLPSATVPKGPGVVVYPADTATKLTHQNLSEYLPFVGKRFPLVVASGIDQVRRTLLSEYPHAVNAIDLMLRDLREGQPVRWRPILLTGPAGTGKSRLSRRICDALRIGLYRFDCASAADSMFGGCPKAWSSTVPSVPLRAVVQKRVANPAILLDETEKSGVGNYNGRLWDAILPFLERETSSCYHDVSLDAPLNLSWINYIATANSTEGLPEPLRDRFRIVRVPAPTLTHLPALAAVVARDLARENGEEAFVESFASDELVVMGRAWQRSRFSMRQLQKIVSATIEARAAMARRH